MCGRFVGFRRIEELIDFFPIDVANVAATENFNVAPTQEILAIVRHEGQNHLENVADGGNLYPAGNLHSQTGTVSG